MTGVEEALVLYEANPGFIPSTTYPPPYTPMGSNFVGEDKYRRIKRKKN